MGVDSAIRYGRYNTYQLAANERLYGDCFACDLYTHITVQAVVIRLDGSSVTGARFGLRWINEDQSKLQDDWFAFSPSSHFEKITHTFAVPASAKEAQLMIEGGDIGYHFGCSMAEPGEFASAFDPFLANQVSRLSPDGLYTGTIIADQVISGILSAVNGGAWFDLNKPEIVMQGADATWKASPDNPLKITDADGNFCGGIIKKDDEIGMISKFISNREDLSGGVGTVGWGPQGGCGYRFEWQGHSYVLTFDVGYGVQLYVDNILRQAWAANGHNSIYGKSTHKNAIFSSEDTPLSVWLNDSERLGVYADGGFHVADENRVLILRVIDDGSFVVRGANNKVRLALEANGNSYIKDANDKSRLHLDAGGDNWLYNGNQEPVFYSNVRDTTLQFRKPNQVYNILGINDVGAFFDTGSGKRYIPHIQHGQTTITLTNGSGGATVTFPQAFSAAPHVVATPVSRSFPSDMAIAVDYVSTASFYLRLRIPNATSCPINWIAMQG